MLSSKELPLQEVSPLEPTLPPARLLLRFQEIDHSKPRALRKHY